MPQHPTAAAYAPGNASNVPSQAPPSAPTAAPQAPNNPHYATAPGPGKTYTATAQAPNIVYVAPQVTVSSPSQAAYVYGYPSHA